MLLNAIVANMSVASFMNMEIEQLDDQCKRYETLSNDLSICEEIRKLAEKNVEELSQKVQIAKVMKILFADEPMSNPSPVDLKPTPIPIVRSRTMIADAYKAHKVSNKQHRQKNSLKSMVKERILRHLQSMGENWTSSVLALTKSMDWDGADVSRGTRYSYVYEIVNALEQEGIVEMKKTNDGYSFRLKQ